MRVLISLILVASFVAYAQAEPATQPSALSRPVGDLKVSDVPFADVLEALRETGAPNVFVDWRALAEVGVTRSTPVTVDFKEATAEKALKSIQAALDGGQKMSFVEDGGVIYVSTTEQLAKHVKTTDLPPRGDTKEAAKVIEALSRPMPEVNFNAIACVDVVGFLREITQVPIEVNWAALGAEGIARETPVTLQVKNLSLHTVLRILLHDLSTVGGGGVRLNYVVDGERIVISTEEDLASTQPGPLELNVGEFVVNEIAMADVVELLRDRTATNIFVNWKLLEVAGIDRGTAITCRLDKANLEQALAAMRDSLNDEQKQAMAVIELGGVVFVTTADDLKKRATTDPLPPRGDPKDAEKTLLALHQPMPEFNMNSIAVADAVEFIKDISKLQIEADWDALEKAGISRSTPVSMHLRNLPIRMVLRVMLDDLSGGGVGLDYVVDGKRILISTREELQKK